MNFSGLLQVNYKGIDEVVQALVIGEVFQTTMQTQNTTQQQPCKKTVWILLQSWTVNLEYIMLLKELELAGAIFSTISICKACSLPTAHNTCRQDRQWKQIKWRKKKKLDPSIIHRGTSIWIWPTRGQTSKTLKTLLIDLTYITQYLVVLWISTKYETT